MREKERERKRGKEDQMANGRREEKEKKPTKKRRITMDNN